MWSVSGQYTGQVMWYMYLAPDAGMSPNPYKHDSRGRSLKMSRHCPVVYVHYRRVGDESSVGIVMCVKTIVHVELTALIGTTPYTGLQESRWHTSWQENNHDNTLALASL